MNPREDEALNPLAALLRQKTEDLAARPAELDEAREDFRRARARVERCRCEAYAADEVARAARLLLASPIVVRSLGEWPRRDEK